MVLGIGGMMCVDGTGEGVWVRDFVDGDGTRAWWVGRKELGAALKEAYIGGLWVKVPWPFAITLVNTCNRDRLVE